MESISVASYSKRSKRHYGGNIKIKEHYLREDIGCGIKQCISCVNNSTRLLDSKYPIYILDEIILSYYLDLLCHPSALQILSNIIIPSSSLNYILSNSTSKYIKSLYSYINDPIRNIYIFDNYHSKFASTLIAKSTSTTTTTTRSEHDEIVSELQSLLQWYSKGSHLTSDVEKCFTLLFHFDNDASQTRSFGLSSSTLHELIKTLQPTNSPIIELVNDLSIAAKNAIEIERLQLENKYKGNKIKDSEGMTSFSLADGKNVPFLEYWKDEDISLYKRTNKDTLFEGIIQISKHNYREAYAKVLNCPKLVEFNSQIFLYGRGATNRAVHGDKVLVLLLPEASWITNEGNHLLNEIKSTSEEEEGSVTMKDRIAGLSRKKGGERNIPTGQVVKVLEKNYRNYVCCLSETDSITALQENRDYEEALLVVPMDKRIPFIRIRTRNATQHANDRFIVAIDNWVCNSAFPDGHFVKSLGRIGERDTETEALLVEHSLYSHTNPFSARALSCLPAEGDDWVVPSVLEERRRDLRKSHTIFSIDPSGCQDIDDTMSCQMLPNGNIEVGVYIADVTAFVEHDSPLDLEARLRSTSVYLVDRRLDMLPSLLSSNLCSLRANVDRYVIGVIWTLDAKTFKPIESLTWYGRAVINNCASLTYEQAHNMVDGKPPGVDKKSLLVPGSAGGEVHKNLIPTLTKNIGLLVKVSRVLRDIRSIDGALELESAEIRFELTADQNPDTIIPHEDLEVHETVAELMIAANCYVAKKICESFPTCSLLRLHPSPSESKLKPLVDLAKISNITLDTSSNKTLNQSLVEASKKLDAATCQLFSSLAARCMEEAVYVSSGDESLYKGEKVKLPFYHYGLAVEIYTHFTSPIRRYCDIVVHRLLLLAIEKSILSTSMSSIHNKKGVDVPAVSIPASLVPSLLSNDDNFEIDSLLDDVVLEHHHYTTINKGDTSIDVSFTSSSSSLPPFNAQQLVYASDHMNLQNRKAKIAGRESDEIFLSIFLKSHSIITSAVVVELKDNGAIVFLPDFHLKIPMYLLSMDGCLKMNEIALKKYFNVNKKKGKKDNKNDGEGTKSNNDETCNSSIMGIIHHDYDKKRLKIMESDGKGLFIEISLFDKLSVSLKCDFTTSRARTPPFRAFLVSLNNEESDGGKEVETEAASKEFGEWVRKKEMFELVNSKEEVYVDKIEKGVKGESLYSLFQSWLNNAQDKKIKKKKDNSNNNKIAKSIASSITTTSMTSTTTTANNNNSSTSTSTTNTNNKKKLNNIMSVKGEGRFVFNNFVSAHKERSDPAFNTYEDGKEGEEGGGEILPLSWTNPGALSSGATMSSGKMIEMEREAMKRTLKLKSEKRNDRIASNKKKNK